MKVEAIVSRAFLVGGRDTLRRQGEDVEVRIGRQRFAWPGVSATADLPPGFDGVAALPENGERLTGLYSLLCSSACPVEVKVLSEPRVGRTLRDSAIIRRHTSWADVSPSVPFLNDTVCTRRNLRTALRAARLSAWGAVRALERSGSCFLLARPPGHHARPGRPAGFCVFNNAAIAAETLLASGCDRVFLWDWDFHHGDGTQEIFWDCPRVLSCSIHADSTLIAYPPGGVDQVAHIGGGPGAGYNINVPLPLGANEHDYWAVVTNVVLPAALAYAPDAVVIAAGCDSHRQGLRHPLFYGDRPGFRLSEHFFGRLARVALRIAQFGKKPIFLTLEGGYESASLSRSVLSVLTALAVQTDDGLVHRAVPPGGTHPAISRAIAQVKRLVHDASSLL